MAHLSDMTHEVKDVPTGTRSKDSIDDLSGKVSFFPSTKSLRPRGDLPVVMRWR